MAIDKREKLIKELLKGYGIDTDTYQEMQDTPRRVVKAYEELFEYILTKGNPPFKVTVFPTNYNGIVAHKDIPFSSVCAHHLLPYFGFADYYYIPNGKKIGLSKIPRLIQYYSHQPTSQEELTQFIVKKLDEILQPSGSMLILRAYHTCESIRGVRINAETITSAITGIFHHYDIKSEALRL